MKFDQKDKDIFNVLSEAIPEGILVVNERQTIILANTSLESMFGYDKNELRGQNLNKLIPIPFQGVHRSHFENYFRNSRKRKMAAERNLYGIRKNGKEFRVEIGLNPFSIYGQVYILALVMDITDRMRTEAQIRELNEELEVKIRKRTSELRETIEKLTKEVQRREQAESKTREALEKEKELNELKSNFLSLVSHEFKTPLSSMLTSAVLAGKYTESEQQDKRDKHLEIIKSKIRNLDSILNDFLSMEKMVSGKYDYHYSTFNLSKVFNEVIYDANMMLKSGQKINYPENADEIMIQQDEKVFSVILSNIIQNAIKFSPENSCIKITIDALSEGVYKISIHDNGIGIPEKDQKHIFERYFRAGNALMIQGTGIGLNMVRSHLTNLGGRISFISGEGKGTTFFIEIPDRSFQKSESL
ncbi:PAS domain-containing sensor histidine kinase [Robertkochia solimangrovi]|uniref:PAS domain-containing sensor histidine kinase n=1 Tax=Robertkochia solimangrovi TaxID=2213046 RepID=UPI00117D0763|nr:PAS domain-containing sensor histidine kinase [Robertkochia solimangrovi]TRZ41259.1 PAS domain-containing sensor histidine kinase [Robertkochia solimangrovi]